MDCVDYIERDYLGFEDNAELHDMEGLPETLEELIPSGEVIHNKIEW